MTAKKREPMAPWLQQSLIAKGVLTRDWLTRKARTRPCPDCHAPTIAGIDDLNFRTIVDTNPLTPEGELLALLAGRHTFELLGTDLVYRDEHRIAHRSADDRHVYPAHECGTAAFPSRPLPPKRRPVDYDKDPIPY